MNEKHTYVSFLTDKQIFSVIETVLKKSNLKQLTLKDFNKNLVDPYQMIFMSRILNLKENDWINHEIMRQYDKTISNLIGNFQEEIIGQAEGFKQYKVGDENAYSMDIIGNNNKIIADIKNKFNTVKGSSQKEIFEELKDALSHFPGATAYYVRIMDKKSRDEEWFFTHKNKQYHDSHIHIISGDKFYKLVFGEEDALAQLVRALPVAIDDFIKSHGINEQPDVNNFITMLDESINSEGNGSLYDFICDSTFSKYQGFNK